MSWMIILLLGVWILGAALCYVSKNLKWQGIAFILPALIGLYISINIAWLSSQTGLASLAWDWFTIGDQSISLIFEFNAYTVPLMVMVSSISFLVHVYSLRYMRNDASKPRFFATLALFTFSMLGLTLSGNLLQLFVFWELVGLCSYLLIGFYRATAESGQASTKALIINKIGDSGFLIALMILWSVAGTLNIETLSTVALSDEWRTLIGTAILIAALAKSAQFPFHTWLTDAMVGPSPVSALIHSATMVAAGVFLLVRLEFLFTSLTLQLAIIAGAATAFFGGFNALREKDLKRFLAWSTLSQLGLMVMVAGSGAFNAAFIHLLSHGIFKAGLFLAAGILIQHYHIKSITEHSVKTPTTLLRILVTVLTLALMGMPLTIGFLSKEIMLASVQSPITGLIILTMSLITALYGARLLMFVRLGKASDPAPAIPLPMLLIVMLLGVGSLWIFYSWSPLSTPAINQIFQFSEPSNTMTLFSFGVIFFGMAAGVGFIRQGKMASLQKLIPVLPYDQWLKLFFVKPVLALSQITTRTDEQIDRGIHVIAYIQVGLSLFIGWIDRNIVDGFGHAVAWISKAIGNLFRTLVTGKIQDYIWWTVIALVVLLVIIIN
jgi:NADH-quinone oxidoreductase subunit L